MVSRTTGTTYPLLQLVTQQHLQRPRLLQLLRLLAGVEARVTLVYGLAQDILQLVVGPQGLLGPVGEDVLVDLELDSGLEDFFYFMVFLSSGGSEARERTA